MTPRLFIKLLRDLQSIWDRIVLMILALSVALTMFSAVLYIWSVGARELPRDYLSGSPASATILLEGGLDPEQVKAIAAEAHQQPAIIDATLRTQFNMLIQQEDGTWGPIPLQIFVSAPDDPMRIETFRVEQGSWPAAAGDILIEQSALDLLGLAVGDTIVIQAPNGTPAPLRISGAVHTPGLTPAFQEQRGHGFMSTTSLPGLGMPVELNTLKIQVADGAGLTTPSRDRELIVAAAIDLASKLRADQDLAIEEIQVPEPYAHPHQAQMDSLMAGLFAFGAAGLLLSALLVATMLNGLFTQHIPQIGIMKAIGARASRVFQFYLLLILLIALTSTALAILPGILISRSFSPVMFTMLGVRAESLAAPWWTYGVVLVAGTGVPLLFALASLVRASRTTVREALDYRGVDRQGDKATRFGAWLGRLLNLDRMVLMAFRNIFRRRARFLLSVGLLASAGAVFVGGMSTMEGFQTFLDQEEALRRWDVEVQLTPGDAVSADTMTNLVTGIPGVTGVEGWSILQTSIIPPGEQFSVTRTYPDQGHGSIAVTVVPPDSALVDPPPILQGRGLRAGETGAIVISTAGLPEELTAVQSGDSLQLSLGGHFSRWQVVGIAGPVGGRGGLFITQAGYEAATGVSQPNLLRIVTAGHDEATRTRVAQAADTTLTEAGVLVRSAASVSRSAAASAGHMLPLILIFLGLSIAISVVGFAGLTSAMSTNVLERIREFGVMSALGARAARVRRLVVLEGVFTAVVSCLVAAVPAPLLTAFMISNMNLPVDTPFRVSVPGVVIWVLVAIFGAVLATLAPASRAARLTVREALAYL